MWKLIFLSFSFVVLADGKGYPAPLPELTINGTVPNNYPKPGYGHPPAIMVPMNHENVPKRKMHPELSPSWPRPFQPITVVVDNNGQTLGEKKEASVTFLVVDDDQVIGDFYDIEKAKERLRKVSGGLRWGRSRLIAEVDKDGNLQRDSHIVAGQKQVPESGFNKWWRNWNDINRMMDICEDYLKGQPQKIQAVNCKTDIQTTRKCTCGYIRECGPGETCTPDDYMGDMECVKECRKGKKMKPHGRKCSCNGFYCFAGETCLDGFCITENGTATESPNTALNTELPNTTLNTELPNATLNLTSPEPIKQTRKIKKLVKKKKKNGKATNLTKKHPRKDKIVTSPKSTNQSEETLGVIKTTPDQDFPNGMIECDPNWC